VSNTIFGIGDFSIVNTGATVDHGYEIGKSAHIPTKRPCRARAGLFLEIDCAVITEIKIISDVVFGVGAVVVSELPEGVTAVKVPAKVIRHAA